MPETTFKEEDYAGLPAELNGKSPAEIAAYYERQAAERPANQPPGKLTTAELYNDPAAAIARVAPTREELASSNTTLIEAAELVAKSKHSDWDNFVTDVKAVMSNCTPQAQRDSSMWETAYYQIKGHKTDELVNAATIAAKPGAPGAEPPTPSSLGAPQEEGPKFPEGLEAKGATMLEGLDVSPEGYVSAKQRIEQGAWPLTMNNIKRR